MRALTTSASGPQIVVIVNGSREMLDLLDSVLRPGHYDVVIASTGDAYAIVKRVKPHLVLVGLCFEDLAGFQVLSMLKLDPETRRTRVVTCTVDGDATGASRLALDALGDVLPARPAPRMH